MACALQVYAPCMDASIARNRNAITRNCRAGVLLSLLLVTIGAFAAEPHLTLRVATYDTGGTTPATASFLGDALQHAGIRVELVDLPLARALVEADRGVLVDADPARAREALRGFSNLVLVEEPIHRLQLGAFVRRGAPPVTGWASLRGRTVVAFEGSVVLDRVLREHGITSVIRTGTYARAALMLAIGRGDVAILPRPETIAVLRKYNLEVIGPSGPVLAEVPLYFVLNKRHAGLAPTLAEAFREQKKRQHATRQARNE